MSRIKHPVRAIREPFGTAGLVVAVVALVLALTGAAFAAGGLTGKQKKEVEKIAKKFAGKPGAPGPAGPQGPAGTAGTAGAAGKEGPEGEPGQAGQAGKSVVTGNASGGECAEGGITVEVEGSGVKKKVCNGLEGEPGEPGEEGSPWTAGGTLPKGATETGAWGFAGSPFSLEFSPGVFGRFFDEPLSFTIPLASAPTFVFNPFGQTEEHCSGSVQEPGADEGFLCVFAAEPSIGNIASAEASTVGTTGAILGVHTKEEHHNANEETQAQVILNGTWAVTGS